MVPHNFLGIIENVVIKTDGPARQFLCGIRLLQDETRIHHVWVANCKKGISLEGHCNSTSITESLFWDNDFGIDIRGGASIRIQNNTFGNNSNAGIYVETNASTGATAIFGLVISGNEMEGNGVGGTAKVLVNNSIYIKNNFHTPTDRLHDLVRGITISDNYLNLEGSKISINGRPLQTPYKIPVGVSQVSEITFNRNVYKANDFNNPNLLKIYTEGLTTDGTIPIPHE